MCGLKTKRTELSWYPSPTVGGVLLTEFISRHSMTMAVETSATSWVYSIVCVHLTSAIRRNSEWSLSVRREFLTQDVVRVKNEKGYLLELSNA